jgi:YcxB-like protein
MKTMHFEFQLNSNDYAEATQAKLNRSSKLENRTIHKWVLSIGVFFLLMALISQEKGFLVVGIVSLSMPIFCKLFVRTGVEEVYEMYDVESGMIIDQDRDLARIDNSTNCGEYMTVEVLGEGLVVNTPSWQGTFKWENFKFFTETRNLLVIYPVLSVYPVPDSNFIIPKRAFSNEEQWSDFRELLYRNIGKRRYNLLQKMQKQFFNFSI